MCVDIFYDQQKIAELYVTEAKGQEFSLFLLGKPAKSKEEIKFNNFSSGILFLSNLLKKTEF